MSSYRVLTLSGSDPGLAPYRAMIYSDFMKSLRYGNEWFKAIDSRSYFTAYRSFIDSLLNQRDAVVNLACLSDDLDNCIGWAFYGGEKLHYAFVKKDYRKQGIARSLTPRPFTRVTHLTRIGKSIWEHHFPTVLFDPFT